MFVYGSENIRRKLVSRVLLRILSLDETIALTAEVLRMLEVADHLERLHESAMDTPGLSGVAWSNGEYFVFADSGHPAYRDEDPHEAWRAILRHPDEEKEQGDET